MWFVREGFGLKISGVADLKQIIIKYSKVHEKTISKTPPYPSKLQIKLRFL
jgi:hypothetical protein